VLVSLVEVKLFESLPLRPQGFFSPLVGLHANVPLSLSPPLLLDLALGRLSTRRSPRDVLSFSELGREVLLSLMLEVFDTFHLLTVDSLLSSSPF